MEVIIFQIVILIFSVVIHELSHGFIADYLGDSTARNEGRLTFNPIKHLDFFGSFFLPLTTFLLGGFILGYAKPVPYNPYNLRNPKRDGALIAAAGPLSNFFIAVVFGILFRFFSSFGGEFANSVTALLVFVVQINVLLGIFNLLPLPPLDGSKILFALFPDSIISLRAQLQLEQYGIFIIFLILLFFGFRIIIPIVSALSKLILGT